MAGEYSSSVTITELSGDDPRTVVLAGAGLPFQGASWDSENNMVTTWYPGNGDEATQTMLGPRELPSSWEGEWKRTLLPRSGCKIIDSSGTTNVFHPIQLRDVLDDIFRSGRRLRITWRVTVDSTTEPSGSVVREGRCKTWKFPHTRHQDIGWNFEFNWQSRGGIVTRPISARDSNLVVGLATLEAAMANLTSKVNAGIVSSNNVVTKSASHFTLGQLESLANTPTRVMTDLSRALLRNMNSLRQLAGIANKIRTVPLEVAQRAVDAARNTVYQAGEITRLLSHTPPEQQTLKSSVSDLARATKYFNSITDASIIVARRAQELVDNLIAIRSSIAGLRGEISTAHTAGTREGDIIAVHVTHSGDTPMKLSVRYYQSPDHGAEILRANRMPWYQAGFAPGRALIIPVLSTAASAG